MNCVIPGGNIKVLGKVLHALCRYGNELYIEPSPNKLSLRTVTLSKTAYAICDFSLSFFSYYQFSEEHEQSNDLLKCKIPMKAVLGIFKNTVQLEKNVLSCKVEYGRESTKIMFKFHYKHDVVKTHYLYLIEGETLQAFYLKDDVPNKISASHSLFSHMIQNVQLQGTEISFIVSTEKLIIRNYMENEMTNSKMMRTQLSINNTDFILYNIKIETEVRFLLQQFKAAIVLADSLNLNLCLNFETSGRPIVIVIKNDATFEVNFVLSTMRYGSDTQTTNESLQRVLNKSDSVSKERNILRKVDSENCDDSIIDLQDNGVDKNIKYIFKRCWETTINPQAMLRTDEVLAESSDPEEII